MVYMERDNSGTRDLFQIAFPLSSKACLLFNHLEDKNKGEETCFFLPLSFLAANDTLVVRLRKIGECVLFLCYLFLSLTG